MSTLPERQMPRAAMTPSPHQQEGSGLIIDPPVGPHSDPKEIHDWLDELEIMRRAHQGDPQALREIDTAVARAVGWLHGRDSLAGAGP